MPKPVDDLVETLLKNPDFYPEKSEDEQKSIAFAIAWKQYNKSKKKSSEIMNNIKVASNLISYAQKLDANGNYDESDSILRIAQLLSEL